MDSLVVFISYSNDGTTFAEDLNHRLNHDLHVTSSIYTDRHLGFPFYPELVKRLQPAELVLFVMTRQSLESEWCTQELLYAKGKGKRIIPLIVHGGVEFPLILQGYQPLPCTTGLDQSWSRLRAELGRLMTPEAKLEALDERLRIARRELEQAAEPDRPFHEMRLRTLQDQRREAELRVRDPEGARRHQDDEIRRGQERERAGEVEPLGSSGLRCVNHPPAVARGLFKNRAPQIRFLQDRLSDSKVRLVAIAGRSGNGKTAMISQWREVLRAEPTPPVDAFVYLAAYGTRPVRTSILLEELAKAVPDPGARARLAEFLHDPSRTVYDKLDKVLMALTGPTVVVIDDAEVLLDAAGRIRDPELSEIIDILLHRTDHRVKLILVTQELPELLMRANPAAVAPLQLDKGLPLDDARSFLRALDHDDTCGLKSAPEEQLTRAAEVTGGSPRALEAISVILREGRASSLLDLLESLDRQGARNQGGDVLDFLIGLVFDGLDATEQRVVQVLAAYEQPVLPAAVDFVLRDYLPGYVSEPALLRLAGRQLIRQYGERFYLPPSPDGKFVLAGIPAGSHEDSAEPGTPKVTRLAICARAARFFVGTRRHDKRSVDDLRAEFAEIRLLMRAGDHQAAFELIEKVDLGQLSRWGHSGGVAHWRQELVGALGTPERELDNRLGLAHAYAQQGHPRRALTSLEAAGELAAALPYPEVRIAVHNNLGTVRQELGMLGAAIDDYTRARKAARRERRLEQEAVATLNLARCLARTGRFDEAVRMYAGLISRLREQGHERLLKAKARMNLAWIRTELGTGDKAIEEVARGRALAPSDEYVLRGHLDGAEAEALISGGDWRRALAPARNATLLATKTGDITLTCEAGKTLALALLCGEQLEEALHVAGTAVHYGQGLWSLAAFAVKGIAAYRLGENRVAREAFLEAHLRARALRERESREFQVLDTEGLVLYGLTLCGGPDQSDLAVAAYRAARRVTDAPGAVRRSLLLLEKLVVDARADGYAEVRRAAGGR
ncbi:TIR domain-containing protein [[Actinomadura] parvosata]|uniref:TIR domain-containing protein n=1 Tax=[Actinomadura] parvosata TaxID=1955412 RepID=UPI00406CBB27